MTLMNDPLIHAAVKVYRWEPISILILITVWTGIAYLPSPSDDSKLGTVFLFVSLIALLGYGIWIRHRWMNADTVDNRLFNLGVSERRKLELEKKVERLETRLKKQLHKEMEDE